jgi:phage nucleotide-binding protein
MTVALQSIDEAIEDTGIKILVHGPAGSGKTVLSTTTGARTLIISAESGLLSLKHAPKEIKRRIKVVQIDTMQDMGEVFKLLDVKERVFDWIVLDSISEIAEVILATEKKNTKDPRQAYGILADLMMGFIRAFRDLEGYNVLMTAKQDRSQDEAGRTRYGPMFPGRQLPQQMPYLFDEVFALRVEKNEAGEEYRTLQTGLDVQYEAKDRSGRLDMFEGADIETIAAKINGTFKTKEEKLAEQKENDAKQNDETNDGPKPDDTQVSQETMTVKTKEP